jgi:hypothetical protein
MKKLLQYIILILVTMLIVSGCEKGESPENIIDSKSPTVVVTKPQHNQTFPRSGSILLSAIFSDDNDLKQCIIGLSFKEEKSASKVYPPWDPADETIVFAGTEKSIVDRLLFGGTIPLNIQTGIYKVTITIQDKAGNSNNYLIDIVIE